MQISLQALLSVGAGKTPLETRSDDKVSLETGFAELLLPELDAVEEVALEGIPADEVEITIPIRRSDFLSEVVTIDAPVEPHAKIVTKPVPDDSETDQIDLAPENPDAEIVEIFTVEEASAQVAAQTQVQPARFSTVQLVHEVDKTARATAITPKNDQPDVPDVQAETPPDVQHETALQVERQPLPLPQGRRETAPEIPGTSVVTERPVNTIEAVEEIPEMAPELEAEQTRLPEDRALPGQATGKSAADLPVGRTDSAMTPPQVPSGVPKADPTTIPKEIGADQSAPIETRLSKPDPAKHTAARASNDVRPHDRRDQTRIRQSADPAPRAVPETARIMPTPVPASSATLMEKPLFRPDHSTTRDTALMSIDPTTGLSETVASERLSRTHPTQQPEPATRPVVSQIMHSITRTNLDGIMEVRLQPEELGRVRLSMSHAETGVTVQVTAERPETLELLRRNVDMLAVDLREQGFADLTFAFGHEGPGPDKDTEPGITEDDDRPRRVDGLRANLVSHTGPIHDGRLDIRL